MKTIAKYNIDWINLFVEDNKVAMEHGVIGHPTKVIIDKKEKIVLKTIGEGDEFYDKIDVILKTIVVR